MPPAEKRKSQNLLSDDLAPTVPLDPALHTIATAALAESIEPSTSIGEPPALETPSKRGRGRPKGARNKRTPTPEGDILPEERYFFQTRVQTANAQPVSTNSFAALGLLSHDDYLAEMQRYKDPHELEIKYLSKLHARAFPQWQVEMTLGYTICLYGWGSKRQLVNDFAEFLCRTAAKRGDAHSKIVVINGYAHKLNIRQILNTIATAAQPAPDSEDEDSEHEPKPVRLVGQPNDILDTLLSRLSDDPSGPPIHLLINSLDNPTSPLRQASNQQILSRLSSHPRIHTLMTCDTPSFQLLFPSNIRDAYSLVYHDATTFQPYEAETSVVDDVNELLGRKGRRVGGSQGVSFVLRSLPENARNLYRLLLSEILTILADDDIANGDGDAEPAELETDPDSGFIDPSVLSVNNLAPAISRPRRQQARQQAQAPSHLQSRAQPEAVGIEYRTLYQKASEEFICSSDMNFRFLLKEFHDHQMITTTRDAGGTEVLGVPMGREEMEGVLEELVI